MVRMVEEVPRRAGGPLGLHRVSDTCGVGLSPGGVGVHNVACAERSNGLRRRAENP